MAAIVCLLTWLFGQLFNWLLNIISAEVHPFFSGMSPSQELQPVPLQVDSPFYQAPHWQWKGSASNSDNELHNQPGNSSCRKVCVHLLLSFLPIRDGYEVWAVGILQEWDTRSVCCCGKVRVRSHRVIFMLIVLSFLIWRNTNSRWEEQASHWRPLESWAINRTDFFGSLESS